MNLIKGAILIFLSTLLIFCTDDAIKKTEGENIKLKQEEISVPQKDSTEQEEDTATFQDADTVIQEEDTLVADTTDSLITEKDSIMKDTLPSEEVIEDPESPKKEGVHIPEYLNAEKNIYGHYTYLPQGYNNSFENFPLIVFLHGVGEKGNSKNSKNQLPNVLRTGVPALIEDGKWDPGYSAIVVSPQLHKSNWKSEDIHNFIEYIVGKYKVDISRIYLTGVSLGAIGTFEYLGDYGDDSYVAAAVPICGAGSPNKSESFKNTPVWAFHGEADNVIPVVKSKEMISAINEHQPVHKSLLTIFPKVGHISWTMTYNGNGMGRESKKYDPFDQEVFEWMYKFRKD